MKRLLLSVALLGCSNAFAAGTLVFGGNGEPVNLESGNATDGISLNVQLQIYDRLIDFKPGTTDLVPSLAVSWRPNASNTSWTFNLRRNVKFHDGTPFNADAVVFNLNRWWDAKDPNGLRDQGRTFEIFPDFFGGFKGDANTNIKAIVKVNDNVVRIDLNRPSSVFPNVIASSYFGIASPAAIKKDGGKYGTPAGSAVGTGPFVYQSWRTGERVTLSANKTYWGKKPLVDTLIVRSIKDPSQRLNELKAGTIDFTADLVPDSLKSIQADKNLLAYKRPSFNVGLLNLNSNNQYLKNAKVRQAIGMAINRQAIVEAFWNGLGVTTSSLLPPIFGWADSKNVPADYKFDPAAAKKLLAEAGYPNGFTLDLWYMPVSRAYYPTPKPIAEAMAADLAAVGIKATLKTEDWAKYLEDARKDPGFDMYMLGWGGDYGDPDNFYGSQYGPSASSGINWNTDELTALLDKGRAAIGKDAKAKVYAQIHEVTYNAGYRIPIVHSQPLGAARTYVKGWVPSPLGEVYNTISVAGKK